MGNIFKRTRRRFYFRLRGRIFILILAATIVFTMIPVLYGSDDTAIDGADIVETAESQIGNAGGMKFWRWYGFDEPIDWCGCFVSWCADRCGYIEKGKAPKFSYCQDGVRWFISHKGWSDRMIAPQRGMTVFFDWDGNGISDHAGIVKECKAGIVYTIEGDSGNMCRERSYKVGDSCILGYGSQR